MRGGERRHSPFRRAANSFRTQPWIAPTEHARERVGAKHADSVDEYRAKASRIAACGRPCNSLENRTPIARMREPYRLEVSRVEVAHDDLDGVGAIDSALDHDDGSLTELDHRDAVLARTREDAGGEHRRDRRSREDRRLPASLRCRPL